MHRKRGGFDPKIIALVAVIALAVAFLVYQAGGGLAEDAAIDEGLDNSNFIARLARETGGDLSLLSEEDLERCQELTNNDCEATLRFHPDSGSAVGASP